MKKTAIKIPKGIRIEKEPKKKLYSLELSLNNTTVKTMGDTIVECVLGVGKIFPIKTKGVFIIRHGSLKAECVMLPAVVKRLLINKTAQTVFDKRMVSILK